MPNRIIKESIRESYSIDQLSPEAECTFYRLITYADDYGIFKADPRLLNKALYPLKKHDDKKIVSWLNEISKSGMIIFYAGNDNKPYGIFLSWQNHNTPRNIKSKYLKPIEGQTQLFVCINELLKTIEINCTQLKTNAPLIQSNPIIYTTPTPIGEDDGLKSKKPKKSYSEEFELFWATYPKRIAKDSAWQSWQKRNGNRPNIEIIIAKIKEFKKTEQWTKNDGQFVPMPATWLNQGRWADESGFKIYPQEHKQKPLEELFK